MLCNLTATTGRTSSTPPSPRSSRLVSGQRLRPDQRFTRKRSVTPSAAVLAGRGRLGSLFSRRRALSASPGPTRSGDDRTLEGFQRASVREGDGDEVLRVRPRAAVRAERDRAEARERGGAAGSAQRRVSNPNAHAAHAAPVEPGCVPVVGRRGGLHLPRPGSMDAPVDESYSRPSVQVATRRRTTLRGGRDFLPFFTHLGERRLT